jgi:phosphatidylserine/phosphatidylglycerophosphate/cardiolipin synthase-like enzyme
MTESTNSVFEDALAAIGRAEQAESTGRVVELVIGNGLVTTQYITEYIVQAQEEVLFSTCFWADSPSLTVLHNALIALNDRARDDNRRVTARILFSYWSRQKCLSIKEVRKWKPNMWEKLGLPNPATLDCLDLTVFSRFRKPFGMMHAKFVIIDRAIVLLTSSNISCMFSNIPISH